MLNISVIAVGKLKDRFFEEASEEYLKRLSSYARVNVVEIKAAAIPPEPDDAQILSALKKEGDEIIKKIPSGARVISLCVEGKQYSSEALAGLIEKSALSGESHLVFIIGGSYGLSGDIKKLSDIRMSMSEMTFPHRLARIMLLEQLYRACKINAGESYHK